MRRDAVQLLADVVASEGLSAQARTKSGVLFNATAEVWSFRDKTVSVCLDFRPLEWLDESLRLGTKQLMQSIAASGSPASLNTCFRAWARFMGYLQEHPGPVVEIRGLDFLNYRTSNRNPADIEQIKTLLRRWHGLGLPGLSHDMLSTLSGTKVKSHEKGVAVATMDPLEGPLTDGELQALQEALNEAYASAAIDTADWVLAWLFMSLGSRPDQFASLKVKDVHARPVEGAVDYSIDVPRVKQKKLSRAEFKNRPLVRQIGEVVTRYAESVRLAFTQVLADPGEAPLFPAKLTRKQFSEGFEHHTTAAALGRRLTTTLESLQVHSERTNAPLRTNALRLRRTFGTRAAQEGHGVLVIAELLDHSDTQHAGVYVATRPEIVQRIDKAVALELAPLAQAFKGTLIPSESEATRATDTSSRIRDLRVSAEPLASCGQHSYCSPNSPLACYTCSSFEPWLDGPHEQLLEVLLAKRDRQLVDTGRRIATIHDRAIHAVAQVVRLCKLRKGEAL